MHIWPQWQVWYFWKADWSMILEPQYSWPHYRVDQRHYWGPSLAHLLVPQSLFDVLGSPMGSKGRDFQQTLMEHQDSLLHQSHHLVQVGTPQGEGHTFLQQPGAPLVWQDMVQASSPYSNLEVKVTHSTLTDFKNTPWKDTGYSGLPDYSIFRIQQTGPIIIIQ